MSLRSRLSNLEQLWPRVVAEMTEAELCAVIARGTGRTPAQVARLPQEQLRAIALSELAESIAQDLGLTRAQVEAMTEDELQAIAEGA